MIDLGESTNLSANDAASALAKFVNITGMSATSYNRLGSVIVALGNNFATTESDIVSMATKLAASGELAGLSEPQIMALATAMSSVGIEAEAGGSAMSKLLKMIQVSVETGNGKLKDFASVAGMTSKEFKQAFQEDAVSALGSFISGLNDTERNGKSAISILDEMGLTEVRLSNTVLSLSNAHELMGEAIDLANDAWDENTALTNEAEQRYATTESKIGMLKNQVTNLAIGIGQSLLPIIRDILTKVGEWINKFNNLDDGTKKIVTIILALVAGLAPVLITVGKLISSVKQIISIIGTLKNIIAGIKAAFIAFNAVLAANPIMLIIMAIVALIAIFVTLWNKCEWFRNFWIGLWEGVKSVFGKVVDFIKGLIDGLLKVIGAIGDFIKTKVLDPIWNKIQFFLLLIATITDWINTNVIQPILSVVTPIIKKIGEIVSKIWEIITAVFGALCKWVNDTIITPIMLIVQIFKDTVIGFFRNVWDGIVAIFSAIGSWFSNKFNEAKALIMMVFTPIIEWFQEKWNQIKLIFSVVVAFFGNIFQSAWNSVKNAFSAVGSFFSNIWNTIKNMFTSIGQTIGDSIGGAFRSVVNSIISFAERTINGFIRSINWVIGVVNNIPGVNISKITELNIPRLKVGMPNVPYDDYLAFLHKGERVLTAKENKEYNKGNDKETSSNVENSYSFTFTSPKAMSPAENARLTRRELRRLKLSHG